MCDINARYRKEECVGLITSNHFHLFFISSCEISQTVQSQDTASSKVGPWVFALEAYGLPLSGQESLWNLSVIEYFVVVVCQKYLETVISNFIPRAHCLNHHKV